MNTLVDLDVALEHFDPVIGLEVHVELSTTTKMFSPAPNPAASLEDFAPNTAISPVCLGLPGSLPVVNAEAVRSSIALGLALGCEIRPTSRFARKNYFYPDLAKNYQISQYDEPIAHDGVVEVELDDQSVWSVEIERAHMEEDAGKLTHVGGNTGRIQGAEYSLVDYNRAGVPLVEIVTRPIAGAGEKAPQLARAYVQTIRDIVIALGVSQARMERGNLRCDANVSLMPKGATEFGTRTETKNVNSFRSIERAVIYEIRRQATLLLEGTAITQETRHWHEDTGQTSPGRPKSDADDYRYFPEPDLLPVSPDPDWVEEIRQSLPETPSVRRRRLREAWQLAETDFQALINADLLDVVEETINQGTTPASAKKWWLGELSRIANDRDVLVTSLLTPAQVVELDSHITQGTINDKMAREVLLAMVDGEGTAAEIIDARGLAVVSDDGALRAAIDEALSAQPDVLEKIREGKVQAAGAIIGQVMKALGGQADAQRVRELILEQASQS
ncbi:aspartyl-tRNA(Asn)/glutamyl-tRNA(Gln) amidotransferase subunit B [Pontimonas salivibrio]|uniref:Aspartyl/glutamyl-tRNA(Asn/Gln) amidotransferase subunit B n=1 Tax=Pontimonas salivibrio TaxID=1159327 RepID=A0A2L2BPN4_9MICO|nr:Asp-tRNA(Asn)/Glu-tRNA(Gln) amidotransferase subunit GatB [Pontimonas salivibrio]AVG23633.1 aspartyl-tRNA(Asn)/glutamyl-tRNA(Gln) amidotransferase subunit B [Pontimonas salivibrio]